MKSYNLLAEGPQLQLFIGSGKINKLICELSKTHEDACMSLFYIFSSLLLYPITLQGRRDTKDDFTTIPALGRPS